MGKQKGQIKRSKGMADITTQLIQEFRLKPFQVENTIKLVDEGCTIPFIARYRKELTGELDDQVVRKIGLFTAYERAEG